MDEILAIHFDLSLQDVAGQLSERSRRIYEHDVKVFAEWMIAQGITPKTLTRSHVVLYRSYLQATYAKSTAGRMLSVARRIIKEQVANGQLESNVAQDIRGFTANNETSHVALTMDEAHALLHMVNQSTLKGKRDYALLMLLIRTGIRRSECAALKAGDIQKEQGHTILMIEHGKGDKRRVVKLPADVARTLEEYQEACKLSKEADAPLFVGFDKGDHPTKQGISDKLIERVVKAYAKELEIDGLTPHGLRASFITLALEGKAPLHKVQYAAGHADPRTTERYQKRKLNLDDNAVDYIHF